MTDLLQRLLREIITIYLKYFQNHRICRNYKTALACSVQKGRYKRMFLDEVLIKITNTELFYDPNGTIMNLCTSFLYCSEPLNK